MKYFITTILGLFLFSPIFGAYASNNGSGSAIAAWAISEGVTVSGTYNAGLAAYHPTGIKSVTFKINGKASGSVTQERMNPSTGEMEFYLPINTNSLAEDRFHTLEATVTPNSSRGKTFTLPRYSFYVDNNKTFKTYYVSTSGNDSSSGTRAAPLRTTLKALQLANSGDFIKLLPGRHTLPDSKINFGFTRHVTIESSDPSQKAVILPPGNSGKYFGADSFLQFLTFRNLFFDLRTIVPNGFDNLRDYEVFKSGIAHNVIFDGCDFEGPNGLDHYNNRIKAIKLDRNSKFITVINSSFKWIGKAINLNDINHMLVRKNVAVSILEDFFDFGSNTLASDNYLIDVAYPKVFIESGSKGPFNFSSNKDLRVHFNEYNNSKVDPLGWRAHSFPDLSKAGRNKSAVTVDEIVAYLNSFKTFTQGLPNDDKSGPDKELRAVNYNGRLRIYGERPSFVQSLYVTGRANNQLNFSNTSQATRAHGAGQHVDFFQAWNYNSNKTNPNQAIIRNNKMINSAGQGVWFGDGQPSNVAIVNNMFDKNFEQWTVSLSLKNPAIITNVMIEYNTFADGKNALASVANPNTNEVYFRNNVVTSDSSAYGDQNDADMVASHNVYDVHNKFRTFQKHSTSIDVNPSGAEPSAATNLYVNRTARLVQPHFYDPSYTRYYYSGDFRLKSGSPAVNKGTNAPRIGYDINFHPRDTRPDIGAFELGSAKIAIPSIGASSPTQPITPGSPTGDAPSAPFGLQIK